MNGRMDGLSSLPAPLFSTVYRPLHNAGGADKYVSNVHVISVEFIFLFSEHDTTHYIHFLL